MINTLHIKNVGIIDEISIDLGRGFNVLTGETGAGKTLIIGSLEILAGGRFSKEMIRSGENYSFVEMSISSHNQEDTIISREINLNGKNLCKINGRMVTVKELKNYVESILDIHGQNDNQSLLNPALHIKMLDKFAGEELNLLKQEYLLDFNKYKNLKEEILKNYGDDKEKQRKLDLLKYQLNEIKEANLKNGEEEELEEKRKIILNSEKLSKNLELAENEILNTTLDSLQSAIRALEKIEDINEEYKKSLEQVKSSYYDLEDTGRDLHVYSKDIYFNEQEINEVEERLNLIFSMKRKYGNNIQEILKYKEQVEQEIFEIENLEEYTNKLKHDIELLQEKMKNTCKRMHILREKVGENLSKQIQKELVDLEMKNTKFKMQIDYNENNEFNENGQENIEFLILTNIGEDFKPLIKIASGGEMSRIMLAIKTVLADVDEIETLVFDEIDTGISGIAANKVAEKMKQISKNHQIICVTHLATIAAKGDTNYFISKEVVEEKTKTNVSLLKDENLLKEIARIASGEVTKVSLEYAKELINKL
ncbi:MAG: DNA repair protein RecN [Clostridia bacterium]|nr:DNA repair protein RecN [Clostridia bacterium]